MLRNGAINLMTMVLIADNNNDDDCQPLHSSGYCCSLGASLCDLIIVVISIIVIIIVIIMISLMIIIVTMTLL